jgi:catechol 2,3-dioxygenase-like lactoylglutathione lyase family enzyme
MVSFTGLRPIHLQVGDAERAALFYDEGLGTHRVVTKHDGQMIILAAPGGDDLLTVSEGAIGADASAPVDDNDGIDHFGFTPADQSRVDHAVEQLLAAGATPIRTIELAPGWPTAFLRDPDGALHI